jgi:serine/threonine-protein kinase
MTDPVRTDNRELHRQIGLAALQRNYLTVDRMAEAMLLAGADPHATPNQVWLHSRALDRTELAEIMQAVAPHGRSLHALRQTRPTWDSEPMETGTEDPGLSINLADVLRTRAPVHPAPEAGAELPTHLRRDGRPTPTDIPDGQALPASQDFDQRPATNPRAAPMGAEAASRYIIGGELGRGGVGKVVKAFDRHLGRTVALKLPLHPDIPQEEWDRFIEEAQATGQLEHPNIVPIYDIGVLPSGEAYYTMKRVRNRSLRDVIEGLRKEDPEVAAEYGATRLLTIFLQVCQAIHYAHVRGVVHRDIKPDNVMLGDYGEVHVMDWGLARIMHRDVVTDRSLQGAQAQEEGQTVGTPAYMPPEQAKGLLHLVDERSDIYSLGIVLYEMMTLRQPSTRGTVWETLFAVITEPITPPSQATPDRGVSPDMDRIIMRALEKDAAKRWKTAKEFHDAVEQFIDGRNEREADRHLLDGEGAMRMFEQAKAELLRLDKQVEEALARVQPYDDVEVKRQVWQLQDRQRECDARMVRHFGDAVRELTKALAYVPDLQTARETLARLYWSRYELAEREDHRRDQIHYLSLLRQYDDGTYLNRIHDNAPVSIYTQPRQAAVFFSTYDEVDRCQVPLDPQFLGYSQLPEFFLRRGSYLLQIKHPHWPLIRMPISIQRADPVSVHITFPPRDRFRPGFVYIPSGTSIIGGDPEAVDPFPLARVDVSAFFLQQFPVTFGEYLEFLNELAFQDPTQAEERAPRTRDADGFLALRGPDGRYSPNPVLIEGPARQLYPMGEGHELNLPVVAIRMSDAMAYAAWRSARDGIHYRLPSEIEWERAARGADGRFFPWGNEFDATFCKMAQSRPMATQPEPVGAYPTDRSPFEVHDLAGGVRDLVNSEFNNPDQCVVRGGYWMGDGRSCRAASRRRVLTEGRLSNVGFRLAYDETDRA